VAILFESILVRTCSIWSWLSLTCLLVSLITCFLGATLEVTGGVGASVLVFISPALCNLEINRLSQPLRAWPDATIPLTFGYALIIPCLALALSKAGDPSEYKFRDSECEFSDQGPLVWKTPLVNSACHICECPMSWIDLAALPAFNRFHGQSLQQQQVGLAYDCNSSALIEMLAMYEAWYPVKSQIRVSGLPQPASQEPPILVTHHCAVSRSRRV